ncbi:aldo/keto reductase [Streptomyces sp. NPDC002092]
MAPRRMAESRRSPRGGVRPLRQRTVGLNSRPEQIHAVAAASLKRLGVARLDLFYQHRVDPGVPIDRVRALPPARQGVPHRGRGPVDVVRGR